MSFLDAPRRARIRAPELLGRGGWIGTGGLPLSLADLRGRFVLLDFWTFCCINCLHVLDELRQLEHDFADVLVVVGVHSPKFAHEADHAAVVAAVERYDVRHPVLDDPEMRTWSAYAVRAWPTLVLLDPEGYVVAQLSGEGHEHTLRRVLTSLVPRFDEAGLLRRGDGPYVPPAAPPAGLRFPSRVVASPAGTLLVADAGSSRLVEFAADATTVVRTIGTGERSLRDGAPDVANFAEPQGLCLLPDVVAAEVGYELLVADTVNHALRGVDLASGQVRTVAGTGRQRMPGGNPADLSSPWDVCWDPVRRLVVVAMAGTHQLWTFDPRSGATAVLAGTANEGLLDGRAADAWLAQPSALAVDGQGIWFADSETSSLRRLTPSGLVETAVGTGLFDFGHRDGPAGQALLQHPLGVTALPDGSVAVCDTYNGSVRRYDPATRRMTTLATDLAEPCAALVLGDELIVAESAAHRLTRVSWQVSREVLGAASRTERPVTELAPGAVTLRVVFTPPPGQKLDERYGAATRLLVSATPASLLAEGDGTSTDLTRELVLDAAAGDGVLHVAARAASCDEGGDNPSCHVHQQDWGVPVRLTSEGPSDLTLMLGGGW